MVVLLLLVVVQGEPSRVRPVRVGDPMMPAAGAEVAWGVRVPAGTAMLGRPLPVDVEMTRTVAERHAMFLVLDDPYVVARAFSRELARAGAAYRKGSCSDGDCQLFARLPPVDGRPACVRVGLDAELAHLWLSRGCQENGGEEPSPPDIPHDAGAEPSALPLPPSVGQAIPPPRSSSGREPLLLPGSRLLGRTLPYSLRWAQCSFGGFAALLEVTGDPERVRHAYLRQARGLSGSIGTTETVTLRDATVHATHVRDGPLDMLLGPHSDVANTVVTLYTEPGEPTLLKLEVCSE